MKKHSLVCASMLMGALLANHSLSGIADAQAPKTFIDYLQPTPISCSPLSSATWGAAGVLPRDTCNGIESVKGAGVSPDYYYWDGAIIPAKDGTFHMFMSTWAGSAGFNPGWTGSESYHAVSTQGVLGPYERKGYVFDNNGSHKGHNTSACELLDGTYALVVSEVVPFTIYKATSLDGPWTACANPTGELITKPNGVNGGGDERWDSNVSLTARHDGKFEIVQRHGLIAIADTLCGPYVLQKPTWTYPQANRPTFDSIYPHRTSQPDPSITNPTYDWEEDPVIWYSGGLYHVLYQSSTDRIGYELSSPDGIHDWKDGGLAYGPRQYQKIFGYVGSQTQNQWYKMERPGVVLQNGHVTHVTWAVADVDKDNMIPAGSNHGSKIIVVPFDGVAFDAANGGATGGTGGGGTGGGGTGGMGSAAGGTGGAAVGVGGIGGSTGGATAVGGTGAAQSGGGSGSSAGAQAAGTTAVGGTSGGAGGAAGIPGAAGSTKSSSSSGCACIPVGASSNANATGGSALAALVLLARTRRRRAVG